jgi:hypothetical protein
MITKICNKCGIEKDITFFNERKTKNNTIYYRAECKLCQKNIKRQYYQQHSDEIKDKINKYRLENYDIIKAKKKRYYIDNKDKILEKLHQYYIENGSKISEQKKLFYQKHKYRINKQKLGYQKQREKLNPVFKLRRRMSNMIYAALKKNHNCKNNISILGALPYTIEELKNHIEKQFESWMTWDNYSKYNAKTWDDNDQTTWTWNIDHIIPHSEFKYASMNDIEFNNCWSLNNLRPLSSKQNWIDGTYRIRHTNRG